jgi:hypothetical protein
LDKRFEWGGTFATDDYSTPFSYNLCQYALPLGRELPPNADLELELIAVRPIEPDPVAAFVPADGYSRWRPSSLSRWRISFVAVAVGALGGSGGRRAMAWCGGSALSCLM